MFEASLLVLSYFFFFLIHFAVVHHSFPLSLFFSASQEKPYYVNVLSFFFFFYFSDSFFKCIRFKVLKIINTSKAGRLNSMNNFCFVWWCYVCVLEFSLHHFASLSWIYLLAGKSICNAYVKQNVNIDNNDNSNNNKKRRAKNVSKNILVHSHKNL